MTLEKPAKFRDEFFNEFECTDLLGEGGQGAVWRTKHPSFVLKLVTDASGAALSHPNLTRDYQEKFRSLQALPIPANTNIALPLATLSAHAGYVMRLMDDMVPFTKYWLGNKQEQAISADDIPTWLSAIPDAGAAKEFFHYSQTGSARRRLIALSKCALTLSRLHGSGLVYGDVSPNNAFISDDLGYHEVWLIDADNLRYADDDDGSSVYTPRFGAPELVRGESGGNFATDCHAFAVMAFEMLSMAHPFIGALVEDDEEDWANTTANAPSIDNETRAFMGLLPWIDDLKDDTNASHQGLPRTLVLTNELRTLFDETFSAGRIHPEKRPSIYPWPLALIRAADSMIACSSCKMTYFYDYQDHETNAYQCPYCSALRPAVLVVHAFDWNDGAPDLNHTVWEFAHEVSQQSFFTLPYRACDAFRADTCYQDALGVELQEDVLWFRESDIATETYWSIGERFQPVTTNFSVDLPTLRANKIWLLVKGGTPRLLRCTYMEMSQ